MFYKYSPSGVKGILIKIYIFLYEQNYMEFYIYMYVLLSLLEASI